MKYLVKKEDAVSYRITLGVSKIIQRGNGDLFPLCPRCKATVEREYMNYCNSCGQHLGWTKFDNAEILKNPIKPV